MVVVRSGCLAKILLIDDDIDLVENVLDSLKKENHKVEVAHSGSEGLELLEYNKYDVILLDVGLPDIDGFTVCKQHRGRNGAGMVLMLTGRNALEDKLQGLNAGADDYVSKPFQLNELLARVRALLRRSGREQQQKLTFGSLSVDLGRYEAAIDETPLDLFPKEFELLAFLLQNPNKVHSVNQIREAVWSDTEDASENAVRTCIARLRRHLEKASMGNTIVTVAGSGYRFTNPEV